MALFRSRFAIEAEAFKVKLYRLFDVLESFIIRIPFGNATGKSGDGDCEPALFLRLKDYFVALLHLISLREDFIMKAEVSAYLLLFLSVAAPICAYPVVTAHQGGI
jgi:hypothetical protein